MLANRRRFFQTAMSLGVASAAYPALAGCASRASGEAATLMSDPDGLLDLPEGFSYQAISRAGELMSDGLLVPADHDGMGCFPVEGDADRCILVRNHELSPDQADEGPYAAGAADEAAIGQSYARLESGQPQPGGTTTILYNLRTREVESSHLSLSGTIRNCSGGPTPWGSWLTCEETLETKGRLTDQDHGWVFEVPASETGKAAPVPLKAMGRFNHEAAAVDPATGIVYLTEDEHDSLFYRFVPNVPGKLSEDGRLQILAIKGQTKADTRNWKGVTFPAGQSWQVEWLDIENVEAPEGDLRFRGHAKGAALFARGEGLAWAIEPSGGSVYFACTNGGPAKRGQIWKHSPQDGTLTLHFESAGEAELDMCDNIVASPWGHIIVCEDGDNDQYVRGVAPDGRVYAIARGAHPARSEFCGACFSPDGKTLFVNMQTPGITFAITGPWERIAIA